METIYKRTSATRFCTAMRENVAEEYRPFLTWYTAREYAEMDAKCFVSDDGLSGYVLVEEDLMSLFARKGSKQGKLAVKSAIENGARRLFCFDGFLLVFYQQCGFRVYNRGPWMEEYAPDNWDYDRFGTPDVVWMELKTVNGWT